MGGGESGIFRGRAISAKEGPERDGSLSGVEVEGMLGGRATELEGAPGCTLGELEVEGPSTVKGCVWDASSSARHR